MSKTRASFSKNNEDITRLFFHRLNKMPEAGCSYGPEVYLALSFGS
jgi:hypothetical protein